MRLMPESTETVVAIPVEPKLGTQYPAIRRSLGLPIHIGHRHEAVVHPSIRDPSTMNFFVIREPPYQRFSGNVETIAN